MRLARTPAHPCGLDEPSFHLAVEQAAHVVEAPHLHCLDEGESIALQDDRVVPVGDCPAATGSQFAVVNERMVTPNVLNTIWIAAQNGPATTHFLVFDAGRVRLPGMVQVLRIRRPCAALTPARTRVYG
jgi:hypothetical protein